MSAEIRILDGMSDMSDEVRRWLDSTTDNPFLQYGFLASLEDSGSATPETGWAPRHLLLEKEGAPLAFMPLYLKGHSQGEYIFDHSWAHAWENAGGRYYPKLLSAVPFTPASGPRVIGNPDSEGIMLDTLKVLASEHRLSSAHINFVGQDFARRHGGETWLKRTDQQFHWLNKGYDTFGDFLNALSSRKRKQIRKERRTAASAGLDLVTLTGREITESNWDAFFAFYMDTGSRKWGRPYLTRDFFSLIGDRIGERVVLMFAERDGTPVAGALNFKGDGTLYGRHWGCNEHHDCLHFELCYYQAIEWAINNGLERVEAGAQGPHKLARGYEPVTTYSLHHLPEPGFQRAVKAFLDQERDQVEIENEYLSRHLPFRQETGR